MTESQTDNTLPPGISGELALQIQAINERVRKLEETSEMRDKSLREQMAALEAQRLSKRVDSLVARQEKLQTDLEKVTRVAEELLDYANLEINSPAGILSEGARIVRKKEQEANRLGEIFNKAVLALIRFFSLAFWAIFGLYLWLGLLIRTAISFALVATAANFSNRSIAKAEQRLLWVAGLYVRGFNRIGSGGKHPPLLEPNEEGEDLRDLVVFFISGLLKSSLTYLLVYPPSVRAIVQFVISLLP